ncbi:MAG: ribosome small subunit-dependent GTPase A [Pseudomonadota bacterium]
MSTETQSAHANVLARFGRTCLVERADGSRAEAKLLRKAGQPVCGDRVSIDEAIDTPVIIAIEARDNEFPRADRQGRRQIIAANVDRVIVVIAPAPAPTRDLVNRYLVACESEGIDAAVCLNKTDRIEADDSASFDALEARYASLGYRFIRTCAKREGGIDPLRDLIAEGTHILVGQSGVGKSSLIDELLPDRTLATQDLSKSTGKGRHTTTRTTLYDAPGGGRIMDSPGVWEYGIWSMTPHEIAAGFREFRELIQDCRFANCAHLSEPGCAIKDAVECGTVDPERYASYVRIVQAG